MKPNINPELADLVRPVKGLTHYDGNARTHDLPLIASSLKTHGQYRPITVRRHPTDETRNDVVLAGNGTLEAARDILGWDGIAVSYVTCDDATARKIVLIDNRANDVAGYDDERLAELLRDLDGDYEGTGFEADDLDSLLEKLAAGETPPPDGDGLGEPVISYLIVFDDEAQQNRWYDLLRRLRDKYPDADSIAWRLDQWIRGGATDGA